MKLKKVSNSVIDTSMIADSAAEHLKGRTVLMYGDLGAGKTAFVKAVCSHFNCGDSASPTFSIMNIYRGDEVIYHFDLYRMENETELENVDFYEILEEDGTKFVEWADKFGVKDELDDYAEVYIKHLGDDKREITIIW